MRVKTGVLLDHFVIAFNDESEVGPMTEKDINCYLYAMKFKDNLNLLQNFMPNIYTYAGTGKDVSCSWLPFLGTCPEVTNQGTDTSYSVVCDIVGSEVEALEKQFTSHCGSPHTLQDLLKHCGNNETIIMRTWDYLGNSHNPGFLYIIYNEDKRVLVVRCKFEIDQRTGNIEGVECEPP